MKPLVTRRALLGSLPLFALDSGTWWQTDLCPNRPVKLVANFPADGNADLMARALSKKLAEALKTGTRWRCPSAAKPPC